MKNIIIVDEYSSSKINGIGTYIRELTATLKKCNFSICIIACSYDSNEFAIKIEDGVKKLLIPPIPYTFYHKIIDKFLGLFIEDSKDNFFLFNHTPFELFIKSVKKRFPLSKFGFTIHDMTWTSQLLGDSEKMKIITSRITSGSVDKKYKNLEQKFKEEQRMFNLVDVIITLAQETIDLLKECYCISPNKIAFIPNGLQDSYLPIDTNEKAILKSSLHIDINEKIILFAGRVCLIKGIQSLIKSFKKILISYPNCRLVIVGTVFDSQSLFEQLNEIAAKVTFTGQINNKQLKDWYSIADIGVLPSYLEQCSYTGIEMMMHKLPIVASDGFCVKNMFKDNDNALVAQIGDREKHEIFENNLTRSILELLNSEEKCIQLKEKSRAIYQSTYMIHDMQKKYASLLKNW